MQFPPLKEEGIIINYQIKVKKKKFSRHALWTAIVLLTYMYLLSVVWYSVVCCSLHSFQNIVYCSMQG